MRKLKTISYVLSLLLLGYAVHGCGGGGSSDSDNAPATASRVYSLSVTGIDLERSSGAKVGVGPLPASGAEITVR